MGYKTVECAYKFMFVFMGARCNHARLRLTLGCRLLSGFENMNGSDTSKDR